MKKNLPSDNLEEFLQNAFEAYTESPPAEVWEQIATHTKIPVKMPFRVLKSYPFWIGAAVAVLTGFIIYQSVQVNKELNNINHAVERQSLEIQELQQQGADSNTLNEFLPQAGLEMQNKSNIKEMLNDKEVELPRSALKASISKKSPKLVENSNAKSQNTPIHQTKNGSPLFKKQSSGSNQWRSSSEKQTSTNTQLPQTIGETIYTIPNVPTVGAPLIPAANPTVANVFEWSKIANLQRQLNAPEQALAITIPPPLLIEPLAKPSKFYVGTQVLVLKNWSRIDSKMAIANPNLPRDRKAFNQPAINAANSLALGLQAGVNLSQNWSLETGILQRSLTVTSTHQPKFRFKERKLSPHGGRPEDCEFEYDLNTPNGIVALAITVAKNAATQPNEDEEIALEIATTQSLNYIGIPIALQYQTAAGKFHVFAKGGMLMNFLTKNEFNVTKVNSSNINFKSQNNQSLRSDPIYVNSISLDYLLQVGVAYDMSKHLSVQLSPILMGSLSNPSSNRVVQSSNTATGLSTGVAWSF